MIIPDDRWYNLKFNYQDTRGNIQSRYAYFVGQNPAWSFWDYISATISNGPMARFKKVSTEGNGCGWRCRMAISCRVGQREAVGLSILGEFRGLGGRRWEAVHGLPRRRVGQSIARSLCRRLTICASTGLLC